jgi:arylsulfatase A-like enzyme
MATNSKPKANQPKSNGLKPSQPNILVIWGDDIGISNLSCYSHGVMAITRPTSIGSPKE